MMGIDYIDKRAGELKINMEKDKSWLKPLALQKYIDESTPGMITEIKNLQENGDAL
jgi:type VI protein secretion system component Hcp